MIFMGGSKAEAGSYQSDGEASKGDPSQLGIFSAALQSAAEAATEDCEAMAKHAEAQREACPLRDRHVQGSDFTAFGAVYGSLFGPAGGASGGSSGGGASSGGGSGGA